VKNEEETLPPVERGIADVSASLAGHHVDPDHLERAY
jgi:hypothetical protein